MARTEIATDAFPYSNGNLSAVSGGNWGDLSTGGGWGVVTVASNTVRSPGGYDSDAPAARWIGAGDFSEDQYSALDYNFAGSTGSGATYISGVVCRASADQDATRDYYYAYVEDSWPNDARLLRIGKLINGTETTLGTVSAAAFGGTGTVRLTLEAETDGSNVLLRAYAGASETPALSVTDNSGTRLFGGRPGVKPGAQETIPGDNWAGGNLGGGAVIDPGVILPPPPTAFGPDRGFGFGY